MTSIGAEAIQLVIRNQGDGPVSEQYPFRVDRYLDPRPAPTGPNQIWPDRGAVWGINGAALPLEPGESITLTVGDAYYGPGLSLLDWPLPAGAAL